MTRNIFFWGSYKDNCGPDNVNRSYLTTPESTFRYIKSDNRVLRALEALYNTLTCDVVIFSGASSISRLNLAKKLHKKVVFLMHASLKYEHKVNQVPDDGSEQIEEAFLAGADKVVCVSRQYMEWVAQIYPQFADKLTYVNNGIAISNRPRVEKEPNSMALFGGNRPIKNNDEVVKAFLDSPEKGKDFSISIFGYHYPDVDDSFLYCDFVQYYDQLSKEELYNKLDKISLLIVNSEIESFSLAVGDALNCHCSVLMADSVAIRSLFELKEQDCIHDPHDCQEIYNKAVYLLEHPNADRLRAQIDPDDVSVAASYRKLEKICNEV